MLQGIEIDMVQQEIGVERIERDMIQGANIIRIVNVIQGTELGLNQGVHHGVAIREIMKTSLLSVCTVECVSI